MSKEKDAVLKHVPRPRITGISKINHEIRYQMKLNLLEYVTYEAILLLLERGKPVTEENIFPLTGFVQDEIIFAMRKLIEKGFLFPKMDNNKNPIPTPKWKSFWGNLDDEFDKKFWEKDGKVVWTGSKKKTLELYRRRRKTQTAEYLISQRDHYFEFLEYCNMNGFDRAKMIATRWLGPQEDFDQDWKGQAEAEKKKYETNKNPIVAETVMPSTETVDSRKKKYED